MTGRHQVKKYVIQSKEKILKMYEKGYTLKEIFTEIPELNQNISYASLCRACSKLDLFEKKKENHTTQLKYFNFYISHVGHNWPTSS
ncbi:hypothetical protein ACLIL3_010585 [Acinetobacter radioresistens]|uniref:hypothetical protein n=1 Tax=Acinetobacter radioresistens TaxID=40216 RepID=UPI0021CD7FBB|nr:hypothetical protein [Acinetobacter radioresistens]MCU4596666.1 hypothetical protein [Acinetobacter radioresistens]